MTDSGKLLVVEQNAFLDNFPDRHFCIRHHLAGHPLFQPERLLKLAQNLPRHCIEFNAAYAEVSQNPHLTPSTGLGLEETIRNIATSDSWVVLKYVEQDEAYRNLLFQCVRELTPLSETRTPGTHQLEAYIFFLHLGLSPLFTLMMSIIFYSRSVAGKTFTHGGSTVQARRHNST